MITFLLLAAIVALVAAHHDWRTGHIPNWLTYSALAAGLISHVLRGSLQGGFAAGAVEGARAVAGALLAGLVPASMFLVGGMGGGDVKLFAALGALSQPLAGLETETYAFVTALLIAPATLVYRGDLLRVLGNAVGLLFNPFRRPSKRRPVPPEMLSPFRLGPSIFAGTCVTLLTHWCLA